MMDLISREDALAVVRYSKSAVDGIENLPSVDAVEVKHGEWVECECSVCGKVNPTLYMDEFELEYKIRQTNYCPNCGAKMDGKRDAE